MKKKLFCLLLLLVLPLCLLFTGCDEVEKVEKQGTENQHLMVCVDNFRVGGSNCFILVHKETRVMYISYYQGGTAVMLDKDGKPLIYEGEL